MRAQDEVSPCSRARAGLGRSGFRANAKDMQEWEKQRACFFGSLVCLPSPSRPLAALVLPELPTGDAAFVLKALCCFQAKAPIASLGLPYRVPSRPLRDEHKHWRRVQIALGAKRLPSTADVSVFGSVPAAHGVAVDPSSGTAFVTRSGVNSVDAFNPSTMQLIKRPIPVANNANAILYDPTHRLIYAASGDSMAATLIDPARLKVIATIPLGASPEFATFDLSWADLPEPGERRHCRCGERGHAGASMALSAEAMRIPNRLGNRRSQQAVVHRLRQECAVGGFRSEPAPRGYEHSDRHWAGLSSLRPKFRRIYTTGLMGTLSVIQQDSADVYHARDSIGLHFNAHTLAVDPVTHELFVGYTGFFFQPRLAVFSPIR